VISTLGIPDVDPLTEKYKKKSIKELEKATDRFYEGLKRDELPSPTVYDLVWFNVWKMNVEVNKEGIPADYDYWKNRFVEKLTLYQNLWNRISVFSWQSRVF